MNVNQIRCEVKTCATAITDEGVMENFKKIMFARCGPDCMAELRTQYRIEYNCDAIAVRHGGKLVEVPVQEDDGMVYILTDHNGILLLNSVVRAMREGHPALTAYVDKVWAFHPQGFDMGAITKVVR